MRRVFSLTVTFILIVSLFSDVLHGNANIANAEPWSTSNVNAILPENLDGPIHAKITGQFEDGKWSRILADENSLEIIDEDGENSSTLTMPETELRALPNGVADEIDTKTGKLIRRVSEPVLVEPGTEVRFPNMKEGGQFYAWGSGNVIEGTKGDTLQGEVINPEWISAQQSHKERLKHLTHLGDGRIVGLGHFAAGSDFLGRIYRSEDNGDTWSTAPLSSSNVYTPNSIFHVGGDELLIFTLYGYIYKSNDGGKTWWIVKKGSSPYDVTYDTALKLEHGEYEGDIVAFGKRGPIARSTDNGNTWVETVTEESGSYTQDKAIELSDGTIIASFNFDRIMRSTDGGQTRDVIWLDRSQGRTMAITSILQMDNGNVLVSSYVSNRNTRSGKINLSTDSGKNWEIVKFSEDGGRKEDDRAGIYTLYQLNDGRVFAGADRGLIFVSEDGENWDTLDMETGDVYKTIDFLQLDDEKIIAVQETDTGGYHGQIVYSEDSGSTWTVVHSLENESISDIFLSEGRLIALTGPAGTILKSENGIDWFVDLYELYSVRDFDELPNGDLVAVGDNGVFYRSTDKGETWAISFTNNNHLENSKVIGLSNNDVIVLTKRPVGHSGEYVSKWDAKTNTWTKKLEAPSIADVILLQNGILLASAGSVIHRSVDNGETWDAVTEVPTSIITLSELSDGTVLAGGSGGLVLRSTDNGETWKVIQENDSEKYNTIYIFTELDDGVVVASGDGAFIYRSEDMGSSWTVVREGVKHQVGSNTRVNDMVYVGNGHVVAVGNNNHAYHSSNLGETWTRKSFSSSARDLLSVVVTDDGVVYAAGYYGELISSVDGGKSWQTINAFGDTHLYKLSLLKNGRILLSGNDGLVGYFDGEHMQVVYELDEPIEEDIPLTYELNDALADELYAYGNGVLTVNSERTLTAPVVELTLKDASEIVESLDVLPTDVVVEVDQTEQIQVHAHYRDESTKEVTNEVNYEMKHPDIASIDDEGVITGISEGETELTISYKNKQATVTIMVIVNEPTIESISVQPDNITLQLDDEHYPDEVVSEFLLSDLEVTATDSNEESMPVFDGIEYEVVSEDIVNIIDGKLIASQVGETLLSVTYEGVKTVIPVNVLQAPTLEKITVDSNELLQLEVDEGFPLFRYSYEIMAHYSNVIDGRHSIPLELEDVTYTITDEAIAEIYDGVVVGKQAGTTKLIFEYLGKEAIVYITVIGEEQDEVDFAALIAIYEDYQGQEQENYTDESWAVFVEARTHVADLLNNQEEATQEDVDKAFTMFLAAIENLEEKIIIPDPEVDFSLLESLYNEHKEKERRNYTDESWSQFEAALVHVETLLNNRDNVTQDGVDAAYQLLKTAVEGLIEKADEPEPLPEVDFSLLESLFNEHKDKERGNYTDESWSQFEAALVHVETLLNNRDHVTQGEVDTAYQSLKQKVEGLIEKVKEPKVIEVGEEYEVEANDVVMIQFDGTHTTITMPDNLPAGTKMIVDDARERSVATTANHIVVAGDVFDVTIFGPNDETIEGPFILTMKYDNQMFMPDHVDIYYYDESEGIWIPQEGTVNVQEGTITVRVDHFSMYGVFATTNEEPDAEQNDKDGSEVKDTDKDQNNAITINDHSTENQRDEETKKLPKTATNSFNFIAFGLILFIMGGMSIIFIRQRLKEQR